VKKLMKKIIALLIVCGLMVGIAGVFTADAAAKKVVKKVVAKKIVKKVTKKVTKKVVKKVAPKPAPMVPMAPPPPVAPVPPPPPPVVVKPAPAPTGMFGWGLNTDVAAGYISGNSVMVGRADLLLDDPLALGSMMGLSAKAICYRIGIGGATGNDINNNTLKAIPIFVDGVMNLPADWMGGLETYVGGGLNYTVYGNGQTSGTYGVEGFVGAQGDLGLGGKSFVEVGYSVVRAGDKVKYSGKGVSVSFGQQIML
jgi:hypothetical protein